MNSCMLTCLVTQFRVPYLGNWCHPCELTEDRPLETLRLPRESGLCPVDKADHSTGSQTLTRLALALLCS